jgi:diguanylate cyclase (GGDEF)-like protein
MTATGKTRKIPISNDPGPAIEDLLRKIAELEEENNKLRSLSLIDNLTGCGNKRYFWMQLETEMARTKRTGLPCTLMMIDLDNFKKLNDSFGHLAGDRFLEDFGGIIRDNSRSTDIPCRYGGDEFALIMPATTVIEAKKSGERLRIKLAGIAQKIDPPISLSIGISEYTHFSSSTMNDFMDAADGALYEAKKAGKNQIRIDRNWREFSVDAGEVTSDEKDALFTHYE